MSVAGVQAARQAAQTSRSPMAHLLHALNQPLTGLQCSLELATAGPRSVEQHLRTLREGLELTTRMRVLVDAIRELSDLQQPSSEPETAIRLDCLVRETVDDLRPVAKEKKIQIVFVANGSLGVRGAPHQLPALLFRFLDSALSLARDGGTLEIAARPERERACLMVAWDDGPPPEHSPFSRPELGLLIAQAGWERAGAEWTRVREGGRQMCQVCLPLTFAAGEIRADWEI